MNAQDKIAEKLFLGILFVWLIYMSLYITTNFQPFLGGNIVLKSFSVLTIVLLAFKELISLKTNSISTIDYRKTITLILFVVLSISYVIHNYGLISLSMIVLIVSSRNINIFSILKIFTIAESIVLFITIISSKIGLISTLYMPSDDGSLRSSLGFGYVSFASHHAFFIICSYLIIRNKKIRYVELIFLLLLTFYLYKATGTSSPFYLSLLAIFYDLLIEKILKKKVIVNNRVLSFLTSMSFIIAFIVIIYFCTLASPQLVSAVDGVVHNRLHLSIEGMKSFGVTAFGQKVNFITLDIFGNFSGQYNYIDSSYIQSLVVNGWIYTALIIYLFTYITKWAVSHRYELLAAFLVLAAIQGMFDPQMFVLWYSPFAIIIGKSFDSEVQSKWRN